MFRERNMVGISTKTPPAGSRSRYLPLQHIDLAISRISSDHRRHQWRRVGYTLDRLPHAICDLVCFNNSIIWIAAVPCDTMSPIHLTSCSVNIGLTKPSLLDSHIGGGSLFHSLRNPPPELIKTVPRSLLIDSSIFVNILFISVHIPRAGGLVPSGPSSYGGQLERGIIN